MKLSMEEFSALLAKIDEINATPLDQLELTEGGIPVAFPAEELERVKFMGLTNFTMLCGRFWEGKAVEVTP